MRNRSALWSAAAAACTLLTATQSMGATVELVTNGGFESGSTGFTSDFGNAGGVTPGLAQVSVVSGTFFGLSAHTGNAFLAVNGGNTPGALPTVWAQDVSLVSGTEYTLSFQLGGTATQPTPVGALSIQLDGLELLTAAAPAGPSYLSFGTTFTAAGTGTFSLAFVEESLGFGGNDYGLDQISLTYDSAMPAAVPLPAGGLLLVSALGGCALLRRRRGAA